MTQLDSIAVSEGFHRVTFPCTTMHEQDSWVGGRLLTRANKVTQSMTKASPPTHQQSGGCSQIATNGSEVEGRHRSDEALERTVLHAVPDVAAVQLRGYTIQVLINGTGHHQ